MNFKEMSASGEFKFTVPEFNHTFDKESSKKSRMAGEYMEKFASETPYTPKARNTFENNAAAYGIEDPYSKLMADKQYQKALKDDHRRKNIKHNTKVNYGFGKAIGA